MTFPANGSVSADLPLFFLRQHSQESALGLSSNAFQVLVIYIRMNLLLSNNKAAIVVLIDETAS
jgi:hypothetical protein